MNDDSDQGPPNESSILSRACQNCAKRKIRCDKATPRCSNCRIAGLTCTVTTSKPAGSRQRVLISSHYERKIDAIDGRLGRIERLLEACLPHIQSSAQTVPAHTSPHPPVDALSTETISAGTQEIQLTLPREQNITSTTRYEGESSLSAHSLEARRMLENLIDASPYVRRDQDVISALSKLQSAMQDYARNLSGSYQRMATRQDETGLAGSALNSADMPSVELAFEILTETQKRDSGLFFSWGAFIDEDKMVALCRRVYAKPAGASLPSQILCYGMLWYGFIENLEQVGSDEAKIRRYKQHIDALSNKVDACISQFRMLCEPSIDALMGLIFTAGHGVHRGDFGLAWAATCTAVRICRSLGWHRSSSGTHDPPNLRHRQNIFWSVYCLDKILSLRLGCASNLQDWDVTAELPTVTDDPRYAPWHTLFHNAIELATLHGLIYEKLYSTAATSLTRQARQQVVDELATRLNVVSRLNSQIPSKAAYQPERFQAHVLGAKVILGSLLTLTQRAAPLPEYCISLFTNECIAAARDTMRIHQETLSSMRQLEDGDLVDYVSWTILNCPFTPFHVLFCNVVTTLDLNDLQTLEDFVATLYTMRLETSNAVGTFRNVCSAFCDLAKTYIAASVRDTPSNPSQGVSPLAPNEWATSMLASIQPSFGAGSADDSVFMQVCEDWLASGQSASDFMSGEWMV